MDTVILGNKKRTCRGIIAEGTEILTRNGKITISKCPNCKRIISHPKGQVLPPANETCFHCGAEIIYVIRWDSVISDNKIYDGEGICDMGWALRDFPYSMIELNETMPMLLEKWKALKLKPPEEMALTAFAPL